MQNAIVAGDSSNEFQPASFARLQSVPSVSLSAQQIGDQKYDFNQGPIKLPFESGGPRFGALSVVSAKGKSWGGYSLFIHNSEQSFQLNGPFISFPGYTSEIDWKFSTLTMRVGAGVGIKMGNWSLGTASSILQTQSDFRGLLTGEGLGDSSISYTETRAKTYDVTATLGLMYQSDVWSLGIAGRTSGHRLSGEGRMRQREIQTSDTDPTRTNFKDTQLTMPGIPGEGALGVGYQPTENLQFSVEHRHSLLQNSTGLAADIGAKVSGIMIAISQLKAKTATIALAETPVVRNKIMVTYRTQEKRFGWMAGPYYESSKPEAGDGLSEAAYGIRFATEILY